MSEISEKSSEAKMSSVALDREEMASLLKQIAGPQGSVSERIARAARKLSWNFSRAKAHWYGEARTIQEQEMRAAREAAQRREEASLHVEISELRARLARIEAMLAVESPQVARRTRKALR